MCGTSHLSENRAAERVDWSKSAGKPGAPVVQLAGVGGLASSKQRSISSSSSALPCRRQRHGRKPPSGSWVRSPVAFEFACDITMPGTGISVFCDAYAGPPTLQFAKSLRNELFLWGGQAIEADGCPTLLGSGVLPVMWTCDDSFQLAVCNYRQG